MGAGPNDFGIPVIKTYRLSDVPRAIEDNEAVKLLESIDRLTDSGKKIDAILRTLYAYRVCGCQVRALKLKDIEWQKEEKTLLCCKRWKELFFSFNYRSCKRSFGLFAECQENERISGIFLTLRAAILDCLGILSHI